MMCGTGQPPPPLPRGPLDTLNFNGILVSASISKLGDSADDPLVLPICMQVFDSYERYRDDLLEACVGSKSPGVVDWMRRLLTSRAEDSQEWSRALAVYIEGLSPGVIPSEWEFLLSVFRSANLHEQCRIVRGLPDAPQCRAFLGELIRGPDLDLATTATGHYLAYFSGYVRGPRENPYEHVLAWVREIRSREQADRVLWIVLRDVASKTAHERRQWTPQIEEIADWLKSHIAALPAPSKLELLRGTQDLIRLTGVEGVEAFMATLAPRTRMLMDEIIRGLPSGLRNYTIPAP